MQTSWTMEHVAGYVGDIAELDSYVRPGRNNSGADLPYGRLLVSDVGGAGGTDSAVRLPDLTQSSNTELGIHVRGTETLDPTADDGVADDGDVLILAQGVAWMTTEQAVTPADPVYMRYGPGTTSSYDVIGVARKDADTLDDWAASTLYAVGDRVENDTLKVYECITEGISAASGGPTGTTADITDGAAHWKYVGKCTTANASAVLNTKARFVNSGSAGGKVKVQVNYP